MLVLVPVPIVYLGETDNKLAARSSYGTGYGLPVQPIAKFGVASPGFEFAQIGFPERAGITDKRRFLASYDNPARPATSAHSDRAGGGHENPAASEFATEPAVDMRFAAKWKMDRS
jgi:hypothetical protein